MVFLRFAGINGTLRHSANTACTRSNNVLQCAKNLLKVDRLPFSTSSKFAIFLLIINKKNKRDDNVVFSLFFLHRTFIRPSSRCVALECCDKGKSFQCQETCRSVLKAGEQDAVGLLVKDCGELSLTEPLWKCFMSKSPPSSPDKSANINDRGVNDIRIR